MIELPGKHLPLTPPLSPLSRRRRSGGNCKWISKSFITRRRTTEPTYRRRATDKLRRDVRGHDDYWSTVQLRARASCTDGDAPMSDGANYAMAMSPSHRKYTPTTSPTHTWMRRRRLGQCDDAGVSHGRRRELLHVTHWQQDEQRQLLLMRHYQRSAVSRQLSLDTQFAH
jgi:hypothetical protein